MFELRLILPYPFPSTTNTLPEEYDSDLDDVGSLLHDICGRLEEAGAQFSVRICSEEAWPVTVRTDLHVILEQLAKTIVSLRHKKAAALKFFEQGIEKVATLSPEDDAVLVVCGSMFRDSGAPETTSRCSREAVLRELDALATDFLTAANDFCPEVTCHPWFQAWSQELTRAVSYR